MVVPNEEPKKPHQTQERRPSPGSHVRGHFLSRPRLGGGIQVINPDAAGLDVHSDMRMRTTSPQNRDSNPVRQFGANAADLQEIVAWLKQCRVRTIALESTGVYWIALFELLEAEGFEVYLVEPGQLSRSGARQDGRAQRTVDPTVALLRSLAGVVSGLRIPCWRCVPTGGGDRCRCVGQFMPNICRRPWSKSMSN